MGVKSSKHSYDVEKVGHFVKPKESMKKKEIEEKHLPPVENNTVIQEIISAVEKTEPRPRLSKEELQKEEDLIIAKVRGEFFPSLGEAHTPANDATPKDDKQQNANDLDAIAVVKEEVCESASIVTTVQNIVDAEKVSATKSTESITENHLEEVENDDQKNVEAGFVKVGKLQFESSKVEDISTIACTNEVKTDITIEEQETQSTGTNEKHFDNVVNDNNNSYVTPETDKIVEEITNKQEDAVCDNRKGDEAKKENEEETGNVILETRKSITEEVSVVQEEAIKKHLEEEKESNEISITNTNKEEVCVEIDEKEENVDVKIENALTPKESYLKQILDTENIVNGMKERILHFSGSAEDKEFSILHAELIKHIIQLDDIAFEEEEVKSERKRVIKMIQQCVENLEKKIEHPNDHGDPSDSE